MVQCYDCGAPCGKRHPTGWRNEHFWCDACARKHSSNAFQCFIGMLFLGFSAILTGIVSCTGLRMVATQFGYGTAKIVALGLGFGGVVLYFVFRTIAGKTNGCLFRMLVKFVGFILFALGVGMLIVVFLAEGTFKECVGVEKATENVPASTSAQPNPPAQPAQSEPAAQPGS